MGCIKKIISISIFFLPVVVFAHAGEEEVGKGEIVGPIVAIVVISIAILIARVIKK